MSYISSLCEKLFIFSENDLIEFLNFKFVLIKKTYKATSDSCWDDLFCSFGVLGVIGAAVDVPSSIVQVRQFAGALLLLQLGQNRRLLFWKRRHFL